MAIKTKDIRAIMENEEFDVSQKTSKILDLLHSETDTLRDSMDEIQRKLDEAEKNLSTANTAKEAVEKEFSEFKASQDAKQTRAEKETAYTALLKEAGVSDKRIASVLKVTDFDSIEINKDGTVKDADKLSEAIKSDWADFIVQTDVKGAKTQNEPNGTTSTGGVTKEQFAKMGYDARFKLHQENPDAYKALVGKE